MVAQAQVKALQTIAEKEWRRSLTPEEATQLAEWLVAVYSALLEE